MVFYVLRIEDFFRKLFKRKGLIGFSSNECYRVNVYSCSVNSYLDKIEISACYSYINSKNEFKTGIIRGVLKSGDNFIAYCNSLNIKKEIFTRVLKEIEKNGEQINSK